MSTAATITSAAVPTFDQARIGLRQADQDHGHRVGALRQRAGEQTDQRRQRGIAGRARDPQAQAPSRQLPHIGAESFDADEEQAEPGEERDQDVERHARGTPHHRVSARSCAVRILPLPALGVNKSG
jgi:hypothetical protein